MSLWVLSMLHPERRSQRHRSHLPEHIIVMHLVVIAWLYVALMMAVAEATNTNGTVLGAVFTFLLYGLLPVALVVYLMSTPARRRAIKEREATERASAIHATQVEAAPSAAPDAGGEPAADAVPPVREKA